MRKIYFAVFLIPLFMALPFINRAYFVDDNYFVEIASWLKDNPTQPYDFRADDAGLQNLGWEKDGFVRMVNPLAHHYYMAALIAVWDVTTGSVAVPEWYLRLGCVLLSCGSAVILFALARRWTFHPLLTTLVLVLTPVFWMSSYSLLIDPTMTFFALSGMYFVVRGVELDSIWRNILGGVFLGLAILSKYPALCMVPLSALWIFLNLPDLRRWPRMIGVVIIPIAMLVAYSAWTAHVYGQSHIFAASARMVQVGTWAKLFSLLVFFSGSLLLPLFGWFFAGPRLRAISALLGISLFTLLASRTGGYSYLQSALLSVWLVTSVAFFGELVLRSLTFSLPFLNSRSASGIVHFLRENRIDVFLCCWVFGFMLMMVAVMNWVAVRYYCLVAPAVVFLVVRIVERRWPAGATKVLASVCLCLFASTAALAYADYRQAEPARQVGPQLVARGIVGGERRFYLGDSFTMSYLKNYGWTPAFPDTVFKPGDVVLSKNVTMPLVWFFRRPLKGRLLESFEYPSRFPIRVMDYRGSAGFYASVWGALPFTWSREPWERFDVFEIQEVM